MVEKIWYITANLLKKTGSWRFNFKSRGQCWSFIVANVFLLEPFSLTCKFLMCWLRPALKTGRDMRQKTQHSRIGWLKKSTRLPPASIEYFSSVCLSVCKNLCLSVCMYVYLSGFYSLISQKLKEIFENLNGICSGIFLLRAHDPWFVLKTSSFAGNSEDRPEHAFLTFVNFIEFANCQIGVVCHTKKTYLWLKDNLKRWR